MQSFLDRHQGRITGVLTGFDRVLFRGNLQSMSCLYQLNGFLLRHRIPYKDFGSVVQTISDRVKAHARQFAEDNGRSYIHIKSPSADKNALVQRIIQRDNITEGLVCVLGCVEVCSSFTVRRNRETKHLDLVTERRQCLHVYFYFLDREFGLMHIRLQTWIPLTIQVCLNGREYLARRLDRAGIAYEKRENCFVSIDNVRRAQQMLDNLITRKWVPFLNRLAMRVNPWLDGDGPWDVRDRGYYWTIRESEVATDVMFRDEKALAEIYPALTDHAIRQFDSKDVMRFLGRRTDRRFQGQVTSNIKYRPEGVRVRHWVEENSIKMYDKEGCVLRIEVTINDPRRFMVRRLVTRKGQQCMTWVRMRKGVADLRRRVEVSRAANERYLEALGVVGQSLPTTEVLDPVSRRITRNGRPYRALRPIEAEEAKLLSAVTNGSHHVQGFRNRDIRRVLDPHAERDPDRRRKISGRVTRWLRLLRAHHLVRKVTGTFYYRLTKRGHRVITTALKLRQIDVSLLAA